MKFKDFCSFQEGYVNPTQKRSEYFEGPYKWLRATDLNNGLVYETSRTLSEEGFKSAGKSSKMFKPDSIAISKSGTIGRLGILKDYMCGNRAVINIEVDKEIMDPMYVFYWLLNNQSSIQELAVGSVQKNLYVSAIENIEIDFVPLEAQKNISQLLQSIDRKIDNNTKIIDNLERNSFILFKRWFIDFEFPNEEGQLYKSSGGKMVESELGIIPEGWEVRPVSSISQIMSGGTPKTSVEEYWNGDIPFFTPKDVDNAYYSLKTEKYITGAGLDKCASKCYPKNTIFITARGTVGKVALAGRSMAMNQSCYALAHNENYQYYLYLQLKSLMRSIIQSSNGAVFNAITVKDFNYYKIPEASQEIVGKFENLVSPLFETILNLLEENTQLSNLRDTLLPKLLSGEIEVPVKEPESL